MEEELKNKLEKQTKEKIEQVLEQGISSNNIDVLDKLVDIYKDTKEVEKMYGNYGNYGNYGRTPGHGSYGEYGNYGEGSYGRDSYGRRGYDTKYKGQDSLDRMYGEYERYQESKSRYGHNEDTDKSFYYMVEAYKDFTKVLHEEAETPQQKQMLKEAIQQSMM